MLSINKSLRKCSEKYNLLPYMPVAIAWFLGYRPKKPLAISDPIRLLSIFLITMAGMLSNLSLAEHAPLFTNHWHFTTFIPSFAASCILIYGSIDAPFSQPRNLIFGHFLSGLIGVCIMKLFMTNANNEKYLWLSGALSVAAASVAMDITGTIHPPCGATALLPSLSTEVRELGWNYLPALLIHSLVFLGVALFCNNVTRQYPKFWLAPPLPPAISPEVKESRVLITNDSIEISNNIDLTEEDQKFLKALQCKLPSLN